MGKTGPETSLVSIFIQFDEEENPFGGMNTPEKVGTRKDKEVPGGMLS